MRKILTQALCVYFLAFLFVFAQEKTSVTETESKVPELSAFHEVIYPIWHTAYPEKDGAALREYAPEVKRLAEDVYRAQLPGILRDKQAKWDQGLAQLRTAVDAYLEAAASADDEALLSAAEILHAKFEMMVRIIRPVLKEIDAFHKVLYVVYHRYLPSKDYENIKALSQELVTKAEAVTQATIPARLDSRKEEFAKAAVELLDASEELALVTKSGEGEAIKAAVEKVHTKYQSLEKIFD